jgi:hypothetical protein
VSVHDPEHPRLRLAGTVAGYRVEEHAARAVRAPGKDRNAKKKNQQLIRG